MEDSDSSSTNESLNIDPSILASVTQGRPRVVFKGREYQRYYGSRVARAPSVIWNAGEGRGLITQQEDAEVTHEASDIESESEL